MVMWIPPDKGWMKMNTDGACKQGSGAAAAGGILRDEEGRPLFAFSAYLGTQCSLYAETLSNLERVGAVQRTKQIQHLGGNRLSHCHQTGLQARSILLEVDLLIPEDPNPTQRIKCLYHPCL
ncbi:hypothetical protein OROMI_034872 [Orobanche minor]